MWLQSFPPKKKTHLRIKLNWNPTNHAMKLCSSHVRRRTLPAEKPTILPSSTQYGETSGGKKPGLEYLTIIGTTTTPLPFALPSKGERLPTRRAELKRILSAADRCYGKKGPLDENFSDFSSLSSSSPFRGIPFPAFSLSVSFSHQVETHSFVDFVQGSRGRFCQFPPVSKHVSGEWPIFVTWNLLSSHSWFEMI